MNDGDVKKITQAVREAVKADVREIVKEEVEGALATITQDLGEVKQDLKEVKDTQENQVLPSVITTETTIKGYADAYKTNKVNIERLDDRVTKLEDNAGIIPPSEFTIQR